MVTDRRFEANTDCPKCRHLAVHWLRAPRPARQFHDWSDPIVTETAVIQTWGSAATRNVEVARDPGVNLESKYEVIRTCTKCRAQWGEV
jgi:hypothetical protein